MAPDLPALVVRGATRTYGELHETANRWASAMLNSLSQPPERVGIFAYRSEVSYAASLAAMMAGATFVPLNPTFPLERTAAMIGAADLDAIFVDRTALAQVDKLFANTHALLLMPELDRPHLPGVTAPRILDRSDLLSASAVNEFPALTPDTTAYLLFTSGSTGTPKGVPVTHGNATYFIDIMSRRYKIGPGDRLSQTFDQTFDLSIFDLFMAWNNGACVYSMATNRPARTDQIYQSKQHHNLVFRSVCGNSNGVSQDANSG